MLLPGRRRHFPSSLLTLAFWLVLCNQEANLVAGFFMEGVRFHVRTMTADSFESDVMGSDDAWILAIKGSKVSEDEWQNEENLLRGVVNVAFIDLATDGAILFKKGILKKDQTPPVAVVFPYGGTKTKKTKGKGVHSVREAKRVALSSLSQHYVSWIESKSQVETFIRKAYQSWPPRFPAVLTTEKRIIPPLYRAIAIRYSKYFNFGIVHSSMAKLVLGLVDGAKIPRLDILVATISENTSISFKGLTYDEAYGPVKYSYLVRFLYSAHNKHWPDLPGSKEYTDDNDLDEFYKADLARIFANPDTKEDSSTEKEEVKLSNITEITYQNHRKICEDATRGFCVVGFFDGSQPELFEMSFTIFSEVHKIKYFQDKPLKFLWINVNCHPEAGLSFGISTDSAPALIIAKPQHRAFAKHTGQFHKDAIGEFLEKILTGRMSFNRYSRLPDDMNNHICEAPLRNENVKENDAKQTTMEKEHGNKKNAKRDEL